METPHPIGERNTHVTQPQSTDSTPTQNFRSHDRHDREKREQEERGREISEAEQGLASSGRSILSLARKAKNIGETFKNSSTSITPLASRESINIMQNKVNTAGIMLLNCMQLPPSFTTDTTLRISPEFIRMFMRHCMTLVELDDYAEAADSLEEKVIREKSMTDKFRLYAEMLLSKFLADNIDERDYACTLMKSNERMGNKLLSPVTRQLEIAASLAKGDRATAMRYARDFVWFEILNINRPVLHAENASDRKLLLLLDKLSGAVLHYAEQNLLPAIQNAIASFAAQGSKKAFIGNAKSFFHSTVDMMRTSFDQEKSKERNIAIITPIFSAMHNNGGLEFTKACSAVKQLATIFKADGWLSDTNKMLQLGDTLMGIVAFNGLLMVTTAGLGKAAEASRFAAETSGSVQAAQKAKGLSILTQVMRNTTIVVSINRTGHQASAAVTQFESDLRFLLKEKPLY